MKKAIVVGATSGIGKELAKLLSEDDWLVGITGRRIELLKELQKINNERFVIQSWDATSTENEEKLEELARKLGGLDLLIMSSGVGRVNPTLDYETEQTAVALNVVGFTQIIGWAYRFFQKQGSGHIVGISSIAGMRGSRHAPAYGASKSYQSNYLEGLRARAFKDNLPITVTDIRPGFVDTPMTQGQKMMFWVAPVEKAARQIYSAVKNKRSVKYVSNRWKLIALILKILPRGIIKHL